MNINILCVEDDVEQRKNILEIFPEYNIFFSDTGKGAVEKIKKNKVDIVLMDLSLNGRLDGVQTIHYLRTNLRLNIPIIAITGKEPKQAKFQSEIAGCTDFISKPYDINTLKDIVKKHTQKN